MVFEIHADTAPLRVSTEGTVYIGKTRVTLQTVITAFNQGEAPEQIIYSYDVLSLADVYSVIAYYLRHREAVDDYIQQQDAEAETIRKAIEARQPDLIGLRARLLKRKQEQVK
jgi:uncharacterized protein (DUF433 family)